MYGLSKSELAILCIMIRRRRFGGSTIDTGSIKNALPEEYKEGVKKNVGALFTKGFLMRKPKGDDYVYSIRPVNRECEWILSEIKKNLEDIWEYLKTPEKPEDKIKEYVYPELIDLIHSSAKKSKYVRIKEILQTKDFDFEYEGKKYYKAEIHLFITCPSTKEEFDTKFKIGIQDFNEIREVRCPFCDRVHYLRCFNIVR